MERGFLNSDPKSPIIICFLNLDRLFIYWTKGRNVVTFPFPADTVTDLEVKKAEDLADAFKNFLDENRVPVGHVYIILSTELVFEKEFNLHMDEEKIQMESFVKSIPFENVGNRIQKGTKTTKVLATNRELYETFQLVFESQGFIIKAVTAAMSVFDLLKGGFNLESAKRLASKTGIIRQFSFIYQEEVAQEESEKGSDPRKNKKLLTMLVVLGLLFVILIVMFLRMMEENSQLKARKNNASARVDIKPKNAEPTVPEIVPSVATESAIKTADLKVQILNSSGTSGRAASVKTQLSKLGFRDISTGNGPTLVFPKWLVSFDSNISLLEKERITSELSKSLGELQMKEHSGLGFDIIISVTKNPSATVSSQTAP